MVLRGGRPARAEQQVRSMTRLTKWCSPRTGEVKRVNIERKGLKVKLWIERIPEAPSGFEVRYYGNEADFSVPRVPGEPPHVSEARAALAEVGLDLNRCSWDDIVAKAK